MKTNAIYLSENDRVLILNALERVPNPEYTLIKIIKESKSILIR